MDVNNEAALGGGEQQPVTQISVDGEGTLSVTEAARALAGARHNQKDQAQPSEPREGAAPHEVAQESTPAQAGNDAGELLAPPGETERADPAASELPTIDPPRSWTKEDKDLFTSLPRDTQQRIAERERSREGDFSRRQQEAAEKSKALEAERSKAEQARQQYEGALPQLLQTLQQQQAGEFADIKTLADVERLA